MTLTRIELIDTEFDLIRQSATLVEYVFRDLEDVYEHLEDKRTQEVQEHVIRCFDGLDMLSKKLDSIKEVTNNLKELGVFYV